MDVDPQQSLLSLAAGSHPPAQADDGMRVQLRALQNELGDLVTRECIAQRNAHREI